MLNFILSTSLLIILITPTSPAVAENAKQLLDRVSQKVSSADEVASLRMTIIEPGGEKTEKRLEIHRKGSGDKQNVLVKMQSPADIKGISLLSKSKGERSDQWYFSPSNKQVHRILSNGKGNAFMGSELNFEDMGTNSDAKYESRMLKSRKESAHNYLLVENIPKGESAYSKTVIWIDDQTSLVDKIEYFDKSGLALKVSHFSDYHSYGKIWLATKIRIENLQNHRGTNLELSDLKLNQGLGDGEFSESALADGD